ncbi:hypothetical protein Fmac_024848 [Flemingia macrophylla]|uniref:Uncharacterized protein n=1 Tax=Flemingia macrophylla TaxID=520843 RepID=A0ABD1LS91_9FABA
MSIIWLMLQISIAGHHNSRGQTLDREDGFQLLAVSVQEMMPLSLEEFTTWLQKHLLKQDCQGNMKIQNPPRIGLIDYNQRGVHDVATDTSAETRKVEGKLDAPVNLVTQLAQFQCKNDAIFIRGVHDVATDTFTETRKVEGKLDALMNLVTQLAVNQKPASVARVCGIRSFNDNHTNACPSS